MDQGNDGNGIRTAKTSVELENENRRSYPRVSPEGLECDAGEIIDISLGGVMLKARKRLRGPLAVRIWNFETGLVLQAEVVWCNPICFRHHEVGLRFRSVGKVNRETLRSLLYPEGLPAATGGASPDLRLVDEQGDAIPSFEDSAPEFDEALTIDDRELRSIVDAWPHLSDTVRQLILGHVRGDGASREAG